MKRATWLKRKSTLPGELLLLQSSEQRVRHAATRVEIAFATIKGNEAGAEPAAYPRNSAR